MRDTKAVAAKLIAALEGDKREAKRHFTERVEDKQRRRKLMAELEHELLKRDMFGDDADFLPDDMGDK